MNLVDRLPDVHHAARVFFPGWPPGAAADLANPRRSSPDQLKILPSGYGLRAVLRHQLDHVDPGLGVQHLSGVLTREFYKKKIKPEMSERQEVFMGGPSQSSSAP